MKLLDYFETNIRIEKNNSDFTNAVKKVYKMDGVCSVCLSVCPLEKV